MAGSCSRTLCPCSGGSAVLGNSLGTPSWAGPRGAAPLPLHQFNMLVSYTYRSDDPEPGDEVETGTPSRTHGASKGPEMKNFSFYTVVDLGTILHREEPRLSAEL